jgi:hypothetical protein
MRSVNMAKIAAEAEVIRLKAMAQRQGMWAAFGAAALIFALGVLILLNILIWQLLCLYMQPIYATLILLAINLAVAAAFGVLAMRSTPSQTEQQALELRQRAVRELQGSLALSALLPVAGSLFRSNRSAAPKRRLLSWGRR